MRGKHSSQCHEFSCAALVMAMAAAATATAGVTGVGVRGTATTVAFAVSNPHRLTAAGLLTAAAKQREQASCLVEQQ